MTTEDTKQNVAAPPAKPLLPPAAPKQTKIKCSADEAGRVIAALRETIPDAQGFHDGVVLTVSGDEAAKAAERFVGAIPATMPAAVLCARVDQIASDRIAGGFADAKTGKTFQCDDASLARLSMLLGIANAGGGVQLIAKDNAVVDLTAKDAASLIGGRIFPWVSAVSVFARAMKTAIAAGNAPSDMDAGWP